jgi:hypothetical protein
MGREQETQDYFNIILFCLTITCFVFILAKTLVNFYKKKEYRIAQEITMSDFVCDGHTEEPTLPEYTPILPVYSPRIPQRSVSLQIYRL